MKNTYIELPVEVKNQIESEVRDLTIRIERTAVSSQVDRNARFWLDQFVKQTKAERATAWFREQELLGQIEGLKKQIRS